MKIHTAIFVGVSALALIATSGVAHAQTDETEQNSTAEDQDEDVIVVRGFRRSLETAQAIKRDSDQMVDSIVAEDIGKLPDSTVAETAARITGVSVERYNGEAANVRVRGLPDLTTTYNGREIFTGVGRYVALQDFPSGTIARLDVYKAGSANLIEAGIAGAVDVQARKPFDFKKLRVAGGVTGLHWKQSQKFGFDGNLLISNRWKTGIGEIGLLIAGSYTDNKFADSSRLNNLVIQRNNPTGTLRYPADVNFQYDTSNRFRPSGTAVLQWRPGADLELYADFLYQGFRGRGAGTAMRINAGSNAVATDVVYCPGSSTLVCEMTATGGNAPSAYMVAQWSGTDTYHSGLTALWTPGRARIKADVAFTDSTYTAQAFQLNSRTNDTGTRVFNFDDAAGGGGGSANVIDINLGDANAWRIIGYRETGSQVHGDGWQARVDADLPVNLAFFDKVQAGLRFSDRNTYSESYDSGARNAPSGTQAQRDLLQFTAMPFDLVHVYPGFQGDPTDHPRTWVGPERQSLIDNRDFLRTFMGQPTGNPTRNRQYFANEKSYAAYAQAHYRFELGTVRVDGLIGLRAVRTTNLVDGTLTIGQTTPTPYTRSNQYDDFLPNVSARIRFSNKLQARLSFTKTRTRPSFGQLNPTLTLAANEVCADQSDPTTCYTTASGGNPELRPIESTNYDASLEYYFTRSGSATVQVFRRDVNGFINNSTTFVDDPTLGRLRINRPENGEEGYIQGVEVGFRSFLRIPSLPKWAQNLGMLANYTYLDHGSELSPTAAATLPGIQPIAGTSKHIANVQVFYDSDPLSLRLSYNYRSKYFTYSVVNDPVVSPDPTLPTTMQGRGVLDFSGAVKPTDSLTFTFSVANLLGTPTRRYRTFNAQGDTYPWEVRYRETVYRLGARFRF